MSNSMLISEQYSNLESTTVFLVVDHNPNCDAIYWEGTTDYRGQAAIKQSLGSRVLELTIDPELPEEIREVVEYYIHKYAY